MSDVADKVRKLLALARNNTNEAEAAAAMAKASAILLQHGMSIEEVDRVESAVGYGNALGADKRHMTVLAHAVGELYGTRFTISRDGIRFVGREQHVGASEATFVFVVEQVETLYRAALPRGLPKSERARYRHDFKIACAFRVYDRAKAIRSQQVADAPEGSRALVVSHVQALKDEAAEFLAQDASVRQQRSRAVRIRQSTAADAGERAADHVQLNVSVGD